MLIMLPKPDKLSPQFLKNWIKKQHFNEMLPGKYWNRIYSGCGKLEWVFRKAHLELNGHDESVHVIACYLGILSIRQSYSCIPGEVDFIIFTVI